MTRTVSQLSGTMAFAALMFGSTGLSAQSLGSAQSFAIVGGSAVTAAGTGTVITGDVGVSPGTSITGFPAGATVVAPFATHANDPAALAAQSAVTSLYSTLAGTAAAVPLVMELGGTTVTPGAYSFGSTANIAAGTTLTLNGTGTYIFQVGSALTANVLSNVVLTNGASACSVFWQITSAATLNGITFAGNVVAQAGITLGSGAQLTGRALVTAAGPVTMAGNDSVGGCSAPPPPVCPPITLTPTTLPGGTVGIAFNQTIAGNGGVPAYTFSVTTGTLPSGLTLTSAGILAGTPTTAGTSAFTIRGTDANGCFASTAFTIVIAAAPPPPPVCPPITLTPTTLPGATVGIAFNQTIAGNGGVPAYTFGVTTGTLPSGLTLTSAGILAGTPTTAGTSAFTIRGTDANGCFASTAFTIVIAAAPPPPPVCPPITLTPTTLPGATVGIAFNQTIAGNGGVPAYTFGVTTGTLPSGLTLTSAGILAGTPTTAGTSAFTIRGMDANGCFASAAFTIVIAAAPPPPPVCPPITLTPTTLPSTTVGIAVNQPIVAIGGMPPYSFGVVRGALPAGITLTSAGILAGTPTSQGTSEATIRATDSSGCFAELSFSVLVTIGVPTLPYAFIVLLALGLIGIGSLRLRRTSITPFR